MKKRPGLTDFKPLLSTLKASMLLVNIKHHINQGKSLWEKLGRAKNQTQGHWV